jgi:ubiquitin C-terminal hydrolase
MYSNGYSGYTYGDRGKVGERSNIYGGSTAIKPTSMISSTGSSNIRASSQLKPIKPTNYGLQPEPTSISIFRTPGIGGSSIRSTYMPTVNDPGRPKGLANLRNTCYINSVLQILFDLMNLPVNAFSKAVTKSYCNLKESHGYAEYK